MLCCHLRDKANPVCISILNRFLEYAVYQVDLVNFFSPEAMGGISRVGHFEIVSKCTSGDRRGRGTLLETHGFPEMVVC